MVTGDSVTYVGGAGHRPIPRVDDTLYRRAHTPPKAKPAGLDWDALTPICAGCGTKSGQLDTASLCPTCRDTEPIEPASSVVAVEQAPDGRTYAHLDDDQVTARFTAPATGRGDQTLTAALEELEATDPAVAAAASALDDAVNRVARPDDHVRPDHLRAETQPTYTDQANLDAQLDHATHVLRETATSTHPGIQALRVGVIATLEALHLVHQLHDHQTPAAAPAPAAAGPTSAAGTGKGRPTRQPATPRRRPTIPADQHQAIAVEYTAGATAPDIARRHNTTPGRVRRILDDLGIERRDDRATRSGGKPKPLAPDLIDQMREAYLTDQRSIAAIADEHGLHKRTVTRALQNAGVTIRPPASVSPTVLTDTQRANIARRYAAGESMGDLATEHHIRRQAVRDIVTAAGHTIRPKGNSAGNADRLAQIGATAAQVRAWARANGHTVPTFGLIPRAAVNAYAAAHTDRTTSSTNPTGDVA